MPSLKVRGALKKLETVRHKANLPLAAETISFSIPIEKAVTVLAPQAVEPSERLILESPQVLIFIFRGEMLTPLLGCPPTAVWEALPSGLFTSVEQHFSGCRINSEPQKTARPRL